MAAKERQRQAYRAVRDLPAVSRDGESFSLYINAGLMIDLPHLQEGADGIGLYRTEVPFMIRDSFPDVRSEEHTSELQSLMRISYAVFCLKKKKQNTTKIQKIIRDKQ